MSDWPTVQADYDEIREKAMCDLVRDPRAVVYRADAALTALRERLEQTELERIKAVNRGVLNCKHSVKQRDRAEAAEAEVANLEERRKAAESDYFDVRGEVERLRWMLRQDIAETCPFGERSPDGIESCPNCSTRLADLESRWTAREEAGDDG